MSRYYYIKTAEDMSIIGLRNEYEKVTEEDWVSISFEEFEEAQAYQKFDKEKREFFEPIVVKVSETETVQEILATTRAVERNVNMVSDDNLLNMDLICALDEKLTLIMEHLGLNG